MRSRKGVMATLLAILLLAGSIYILGWSTILSVKKIEITGTSRLTLVQQILDSSSGHLKIGKPLARVNVRVINRTLKDISWVASEQVHRNWWKGIVRVELTERTPIAFFENAQGARTYLDESGAQFSTPEILQNLPQITFASDDADSKKSVAHLLAHMPSDFILGLQGVHVSASSYIDMQVSVAGKALTVRWGSDEDIATKIKVFRALYALPENSKATIYDLSAPSAPITK